MSHSTKLRIFTLGATLLVLANVTLARDTAATAAFTNESIAGKYALVQTGTGGQAPTAGVGLLTADAAGNLWGHLLVSVPDAAPGARKFSEIPLRFTYTLHRDGTGRMTLTNAPIKEATFLITKAAPRFVRHGHYFYPAGLIAQEITAIGKEAGALQGNLITATLTRLPEGEDGFTTASLSGKYTVVIAATGGAPATAGQALVIDDEQGNFTGKIKFHNVDPVTGERSFVELPASGSFSVNPDGTGKIEFRDTIIKEAHFVVTKAERRTVRFGQHVYPGVKVALETALVIKEPGPGGHLLTGTSVRLPE
jgi:hypothetical protein